jgi:type 2 lantibiotic biosynthesis protein LanM
VPLATDTTPAARWARFFPELDGPADVARLLDELLPADRPGPPPAAPVARGGRPSDLDGPHAPELPFLPLLRGLVGPVLDELLDRLAAEPLLAAGPAERLRTVAPLLGTLHTRLARVLVTDLHAAARAGRLAGSTPQERFASFAAGLDPDAVRRRWPSLVSELDRAARDRRDALTAVLAGTRAHRAALTRTFGELADAGRVVRIVSGAGDLHRGGASVAVLEFESGFRLVHKPRSLAVDAGFAGLLAWLDDRLGLGLRHPRTVTHGDAGWMEHVEQRPPADAAEARTYHRRVGQLAALLHLLDACDVHHENLICAGDRPVLVDCETLLRAALPAPGGRSAREVVEERLAGSVTGLGLLPTVVVGADGDGADIGGVGFEPGARAPFRGLAVVNPGRDDMHLTFRYGELSPGAAAPAAGLLRPAELLEALQDGFRTVGEWATGHAEELAGQVAARLGGVEIRYLHNPTYFYAQLLSMTSHPEPAADPDTRRVLLCRVGLRRPDAPVALTRAELRDLERGDVPYFTARTDSRELYDSAGRSLGALLRARPVDGAVERIRRFDRRALADQLDLIGLSLVNKYDAGATASGFTLDGPVPRHDDRLAVAAEIGDRLLATMVAAERPGGTPTWAGPLVSTVEARLWRPGPIGFDLYGGVSGLALLLAGLARVTGAARYADGALRVFEPLATELADGALDRDVPAGFFTGTAGLLWALGHAGRLLDRPDLTAAALAQLPRLHEGVDRDTTYDLIGGAAGILAAALALHRLAGPADRPAALAVARHAHRHLAAGHPALAGTPGGPLFSGFGHGVAGIAPYLAELHRVTGDPAAAADAARLQEARDALRTGADWFTSDRRDRVAAAWCHGAPGILLGLVLTARSGLPVAGDAVRDAVAATVAGGFGNTVTYCHGDPGNLEILGLAAEVTGDAVLARRADAGTRRLVHAWRTTADRNPHSKYAYSSSAMLGSAAVGHGLLRAVAGDEVPPLLWAG